MKLRMLTDGQISALTGEVNPGLEGLLVAGCHPHTVSGALWRHLVQFQIPQTANETSLTGRNRKKDKSTSQKQLGMNLLSENNIIR